MPVAIGATGVALFALRALDAPVSLIVGITVAVCVVWTLCAALLYSDYARALAGALKRQMLPDATPDLGDSETAAALHRMLASDDAREVRLGLDLLVATSSPAAQTELARLSRDPRADVRMPALARLAVDGNARAAALLESDIAGLSTSRDVADRRIAAQCLAVPTGVDRAPLTALLRDPEPAVRADGLAAVGVGDAGHVEDVVAALEDPATCGAAVAAVGRLGDAVLPSVANALAATAVPVPAATVRLARGVRNASPEAVVDCLGPHVEHPDRELGLAVRSALAAAGVEAAPLAADIEPALRADAEHAARCLAALAAVTPAPLLERALRDELVLLRERVLALLAVRHGAEAIHLVALGLASGAESRRSLAIEMLDVTLGARRGGTRLTGGADGPARPRSPAAARRARSGCSARSSRSARRPHRRPRRALAIALAGCVRGLRGAQGRIASLQPRRAAEAADPVLRETLEWAARSAAE